MIKNKILELQIQRIMNSHLFQKNVIDEKTFFRVEDELLQKIKSSLQRV